MEPLFSQSVPSEAAQQTIYDVIVVGAGPAGSTAAYYLAQEGAQVLLVDRASFPRDKACGDAVMPSAMAELRRIGLAEQIISTYSPVGYLRSVNLWGLSTHDHIQPLGQENDSCGYLVPRKELDALLCAHALQQFTCSWLDRTEVRSVSTDQTHDSGYAEVHAVRRDEHRILHSLILRARFVIAADGSSSTLARQLRKSLLQQPSPDILALTPSADDYTRLIARSSYWTDIKLLDHTLEFFFNEAGLHYFWVFPVNEQVANVGAVAVKALARSHKLQDELLERFLHSHLAERSSAASPLGPWRSAPINAGLCETALYGPRMLCVGDAAALVEPLYDEGISAALWSGRTAATYLLKALAQSENTSTFLRSYAQTVREHYQTRYETRLHQLSTVSLLQEIAMTVRGE